MNFLGIPDDAFVRGKVPITKQEIRILTLAKARLGPEAVVYDIGAGTGSISVEAARQAPKGHVYALERNSEAIALIRANAEKFGVENLSVIEAEAPLGMENLPPCDAVFIGGSGGHMEKILDVVCTRLRPQGRVVINCIAVQSLMQCLNYLKKKEGFLYEAVQVQATRLRQVGPYDMADALNPVYIVTGWRNG